MKTIRDVLNKIKWTSGLNGVEIIIIHRGNPNNMKIIKGEEIIDIAPRAIICENAIIPYHRVICIKKDGLEVWRKK
ncbi:MAG: DUF504 domain-containing protein [Candidatus Methanomethyliaceae archaeon]|nr:DUF504 domain-containing protein [Candidatus Methanomethyliaceae archaeon]MCX8169632.1 DUF504 domain-containing protein [Candidatus Methanomethyliaceae archaeon]MDW7971025.1 DUF504 domain-containing protein [Nitrososphaerota archaeon]